MPAPNSDSPSPTASSSRSAPPLPPRIATSTASPSPSPSTSSLPPTTASSSTASSPPPHTSRDIPSVILVAPASHTMQTKDGEGNNLGFLLKQGAEARIFALTFLGRRSIVKERLPNEYLHPFFNSEEFTVKRLKKEARFMTKARRLAVLTPTLYAVDPLLHTLTFEYIEGPPVKDVLLDFGFHGVNEEKLNDIALQIGNAIGKLHDGGLVHGNLRTSNMIIQRGTNQLVLIGFGVSFTSTDPEDKAVDLYVLERALLPMKSSCGNVMDRILAAYKKSSRQPGGTLNKLAQERGRS